MVQISVGEAITIEKTGEKNGKQWALAKAKSDNPKSYDAIDVWVENAHAVNNNRSYKVARILSVKKSARKYEAKDGSEKWADVYSVNVEVEENECSPAIPSGFSQLNDEDIPF